MEKSELKKIVSNHLNKMMDGWFSDNELFKALGKTIIQANVNKFDGLIDLLTDENGNVLVDDLIKNLGDTVIGDGIKIDLTKYSSLLPRRILIFSKSDLNELVGKIKGSAKTLP